MQNACWADELALSWPRDAVHMPLDQTARDTRGVQSTSLDTLLSLYDCAFSLLKALASWHSLNCIQFLHIGIAKHSSSLATPNVAAPRETQSFCAMSAAFSRLPTLHCCTGLTHRCSGRAVQWAVAASQPRDLSSSARQQAAPLTNERCHVLPASQFGIQRRRHCRAACVSVASASGNGSGSNASDRYIITTPLYYVNAGGARRLVSCCQMTQLVAALAPLRTGPAPH